MKNMKNGVKGKNISLRENINYNRHIYYNIIKIIFSNNVYFVVD